MAKRAEVLFAPSALADLEEIVNRLRLESPANAAKFLDRIDKAVGQLERFPRSGTEPKDEVLRAKGYRVVVVQKYLPLLRREGT